MPKFVIFFTEETENEVTIDAKDREEAERLFHDHEYNDEDVNEGFTCVNHEDIEVVPVT